MTSKKQQIVFIWGAYPPTIGGASARIYRIAAHLSNLFKVCVFTPRVKNSAFKEIRGDLKIYRVPPTNPKIDSSKSLLYYLQISQYFAVILSRIMILYPFLLFTFYREKPIAIIKEATTWDFEIIEQKVKLKSLFLLFKPWIFISKILKIPLYVYFTNLWYYKENSFYLDSKLKYADKIIVVDSWMQTYLKEKLAVNKPIYYLPVSIDCDLFANNNLKFPSENKILSVSRFSKERGCDVLIKAIPYVRKQVRSLKVEIVGGGSELINLISLAKDLGVYDCVTFKGEIDPRNISICYNETKVFVNPLRVPGIGNSTLEALASGVPVIKSKVKGMENEPIIEGINGFSFEMDDHKDLADKIIKIMELNEEEWVNMSLNCKNTANRYNLQNTSTKLLEILYKSNV
jgi:glycosyltransferase involved in cell wall biosynthesis